MNIKLFTPPQHDKSLSFPFQEEPEEEGSLESDQVYDSGSDLSGASYLPSPQVPMHQS